MSKEDDPIDYMVDKVAQDIRDRKSINRWKSEWKSTNAYEIQKLLESNGGAHLKSCFENYKITDEEMEKAGAREFLKKSKAYASRIRQHFIEGTNLVFAGDPGTGKDHMVMAIAKEAIREGLWVAWVSGMDLRDASRKAIKTGDNSEIEKLMDVDILWISDPAIEGLVLTDYQMEVLYKVVDYRYRHQLPIWVTVNASDGECADEILGSLTYDRLRSRAFVFMCKWPSYRKPRD